MIEMRNLYEYGNKSYKSLRGRCNFANENLHDINKYSISPNDDGSLLFRLNCF